MYPDVLALRAWYNSGLGRSVQAVLKTSLKHDLSEQAQVLLLGYGTPLWSNYKASTIAAMPAQMGAIQLPRTAPNRSVQVWEDALPFADNQFDLVVMLHCLEHTANPAATLAEVARVLRPNGVVDVLVPHRLSMWARAEGTPFGSGQPFSTKQLENLLSAAELSAENCQYLLHYPPLNSRLLLKYTKGLERFAQRYWLPGGGLVHARAVKDVMGGLAAPVAPAKRQASMQLKPA